MSDHKYCAFLDVLGYKNIVEPSRLTIDQKKRILSDIYGNLQSTAAIQVKHIRHFQREDEKLYIKSFSDCVYIESNDPFAVLYTLHNTFNLAFGYNTSLPEKYTPLLRAGLVKDWTMKVMDIASLVYADINDVSQNDSFKNPIGLGVARAYLTSEASKLSGMRIIVSPEIFEEVKLVKYDKVPFECYSADCPSFMKQEGIPKSQNPVKLYFLPVTINENGKVVNLFELCWPVFNYVWSPKNTDIDSRLDALQDMRDNFDEDSIRHYKKTAELILKALIITNSVLSEEFNKSALRDAITDLQSMSGTSFDLT